MHTNAHQLIVIHVVCAPAGVLVSAAKRLMPGMNQQELCNTAWALGVLGQLDKDTWQEFCDCVVNAQGVFDNPLAVSV